MACGKGFSVTIRRVCMGIYHEAYFHEVKCVNKVKLRNNLIYPISLIAWDKFI